MLQDGRTTFFADRRSVWVVPRARPGMPALPSSPWPFDGTYDRPSTSAAAAGTAAARAGVAAPGAHHLTPHCMHIGASASRRRRRPGCCRRASERCDRLHLVGELVGRRGRFRVGRHLRARLVSTVASSMPGRVGCNRSLTEKMPARPAPCTEVLHRQLAEQVVHHRRRRTGSRDRRSCRPARNACW